MDKTKQMIEKIKEWEQNAKELEEYYKAKGTKIIYTTDNIIHILEKVIKELKNAN